MLVVHCSAGACLDPSHQKVTGTHNLFQPLHRVVDCIDVAAQRHIVELRTVGRSRQSGRARARCNLAIHFNARERNIVPRHAKRVQPLQARQA